MVSSSRVLVNPSYHLGGDFFRDPDGTLAWGAQSYVKKMLHNYEIMFEGKPKEYTTPMAERIFQNWIPQTS
jgi:hypothetical protein